MGHPEATKRMESDGTNRWKYRRPKRAVIGVNMFAIVRGLHFNILRRHTHHLPNDWYPSKIPEITETPRSRTAQALVLKGWNDPRPTIRGPPIHLMPEDSLALERSRPPSVYPKATRCEAGVRGLLWWGQRPRYQEPSQKTRQDVSGCRPRWCFLLVVGICVRCGLGRREMMQMRYAQILGRRVPWLLEGSDVRKACQEDAFGGKSISTAISKLANMLRHSKSY